MRFLLFNVVVGLALLNLFGGGLDLNDLKQRFLSTESVIEMTAETPAAPIVVAAKQGPGSGRDVIGEPEPKPPVKKPVTKPVKKPKQSSAAPALPKFAPALPKFAPALPKFAPALPKLAEARTIAPAPEPKMVPNAVAKRRAEVLGTEVAQGTRSKPARRVALKAGAAMMSTADRRRELDALVEEMEMLYLDKVGG